MSDKAEKLADEVTDFLTPSTVASLEKEKLAPKSEKNMPKFPATEPEKKITPDCRQNWLILACCDSGMKVQRAITLKR